MSDALAALYEIGENHILVHNPKVLGLKPMNADPQHPEHEELIDWLGGEFDPEGFDAGEVNEVL